MKMQRNAIWTLIFCELIIVNCDEYPNSASPSVLILSDDSYGNDLKSEDFKTRGSRTYESSDDDGNEDGSYSGKWIDTIPGEAGKDFPSYEKIPKTSFTCKGRKTSGYYADIETDCQVFHVCAAGGQKISFLCPNGSIFNQKVLVCDWWYDVDCLSSNAIVESYEYESRFQNDQREDLVLIDGFGDGYDLSLASSGGNEPPQKANVIESVNDNGNTTPKEDSGRNGNRISKSKKISKE